MKTNLKKGIWIEGFDDHYELISKLDSFTNNSEYKGINILYRGKTWDVPEDLTKKCVQFIKKRAQFEGSGKDGYNYYFRNYQGTDHTYGNSIHSIQSACSDKYCIIYKQL